MKSFRTCVVVVLGAALGGCAGFASEPPAPPRAVLDHVVEDDGELRPGALDTTDGLEVARAAATGVPEMLRAADGLHLAFDDASAAPVERARDFFRRYGAVIGLDAADRARPPIGDARVVTDVAGRSHVRIPQVRDGIPVLGAEVVVHLDDQGVLAVTGTWVPDTRVGAVPAISASEARLAAARAVEKAHAAPVVAADPQLAIVRTGLLAGVPGATRLAWTVEVRGEDVVELAWVDASDARVLERYPLRHDARHRIVYAPVYEPSQPDLFKLREEGQGPTLVPQVDHLYDYSGQVHDFFSGAFGRDSFDGAGAIMRTVYLVNQQCPNAYWDGSTTNYCPLFDLDDVVAHEWGHAYTQHTHGLIYAYQSGALNESYSDIWGETIDLLNGVDGLGGGANDAPAPEGVRWAVGEDFGTGNGEYELLLRDMWDPDRLGSPGHVTSESYACGTDDQGGVHTNSGVPNHAYALLVDGGTFRGVTVEGIGFVKAAHLYYQAMTAYQTPTTNFVQHADALEMSCADLTGAPLEGFFGLTSTTITAADCDQLAAALEAVEMRTPPPCPYEPVLYPGAPEACPGGAASLREDWSDGLAGWTGQSVGVHAEWPGYAWTATSNLPAGHGGSAAFAIDSTAGTCAPGGDYSGRFSIDSPPRVAPAGRLELRFEHFVETEASFDGGNLQVSRNGGAFTLVPPDAFRWNGPRSNLDAAAPLGQSTNPKAGEAAWHGADEGGATGSWGTTVVDLSQIVAAGDTYRLRFDFGIDGCNGVTGWYVGAVSVDECPALEAPALAVTAYEAPDTDGAFTMQWTRPSGAVAPDELQQSTVACAPRLADDGEAGLALWNATTIGSGTSGWQAASDKPLHGSTAIRALGVEGAGNAASIVTTRQPLVLPSGSVVTLQFSDWFVNELDDRGYVEVSADDGATWTAVYTADRALLIAESDVAFVTEALTAHTIDLSGYAGRSILLRFRYQLGPTNYFLYKPVGWYLDDISVTASRWDRVYAGAATSLALGGRASGDYCYRARTTHAVNGVTVPSVWSDAVSVQVRRSDGAADTDGDTLVDGSDNCAATENLDQTDRDRDGLGDACDPCPTRKNNHCRR